MFEHEGTVDHSRSPGFAVSSDGSRLAVGSAAKVEVFDLAGGVTTLPLDESTGARLWSLSPDGSQVALSRYVEPTSEVVIVDVTTGDMLARFTDTLRGHPLWSADARYLIVDSELVTADDFAVVQDFATGQLHSLQVVVTPTYVDSLSYTVSGNLTIDGGAAIEVTGTVDGNEGQRYLEPQARLPYPATLELELQGHPWRIYANQAYSLDYSTTIEPDAWLGSVTDRGDAPDDQSWHPLRL